MRTIIVDDEKPALDNLKRKLDGILEYEVVGMFQDERKALEELSVLEPDIIFVDIEMKFMNGLEFLEGVFDLNLYPKIIFVTAYTQYAHEAFELNAFDFIKKPVDSARLQKTLEKIEFQKKILLSEHKVKNVNRINCFQEFSIYMSEQELHMKWRTKKVEELFLYLLCNYDKAVSKEKLLEILWDGMEREKSLQYLYNTMYNLKKLEGELFRMESTKGKIRILLSDTWCDMIEFDKAFRSYKANPQGSESSMNRIRQLYKGILLREYDYSWLPEYQGAYEGMRAKMEHSSSK